jgi:hypothetical protein
MGSVPRPRPPGFKNYVAQQGFHTVYLVTTARSCPTKVGIARDPVRRLGGLQAGHFDQLSFHRFWWLPGRPIAARIERQFKEHFAAMAVRGEWFDVAPPKAEAFIVEAIRSNGTWGIDQEEMAKLMKQWELHQLERSLSRISPSSLLGWPQQVKWSGSRLAR